MNFPFPEAYPLHQRIEDAVYYMLADIGQFEGLNEYEKAELAREHTGNLQRAMREIIVEASDMDAPFDWEDFNRRLDEG